MDTLNKAHALILGGGYNHLFLIIALKKAGYRITLVDKDHTAPGRLYADEKIVSSTFDLSDDCINSCCN